MERGDVNRVLADFPVNIWKDPSSFFSNSDFGNETNKEKHRTLKELVKASLMASISDPIKNIKFIDLLCRLGVSYHFETEIEDQLVKLFGNDEFNEMIRQDEECDLYTVGLLFQVFRQFGFKISADVFEKFKDRRGKFKGDLVADPRGILSLYEAVQWRTHGEHILEEALDFSASNIQELASRSIANLAIRIKNALKHSYHKGISRIETRQYISFYEQEETRDTTLLEFAKIDFNLLQIMYREELCCVARWFQESEIESKVPYARHRIAETYLWALGAYFEPQYSRARVTLAIALIIFTLIDDTYDSFGIKEELELFTQAIDKWLPSASDLLPDSIKHVYHVMADFFDKIEKELENEGRKGCGFHIKNSLKITANGYMKEANWLEKDYIATFDEYKENAIFSSGYYAVISASFAGMEDVASLDAFEWLSSHPKIRVAAEIICRLRDDISGYEFEHERKHVATGIDCYMKQYNVSKEKAVESMEKLFSDAWMDLNDELMRPHTIPFPLLMRIFNLSRVIDVFYRYQDAYTHPELLKGHIVALIVDNIPV